MSEVVRVTGLSKAYNSKSAIKDISLSVGKGTAFGLLGANGAGKSTTIECMLGTKKMDSGEVNILGYNPAKDRHSLFEKVGVQFQDCSYQPEIKVYKLCEEISCLYKHPGDWKKLCSQFGVGDKVKNAVKSLSGGERQKLFIVLALNGAKPAFDGSVYTFLEQSFGAVCTISICAGGLMGLSLAVSEYRELKILKRFKVTPIRPSKLLVVQFSIYVIYCVVSMVTLLIAAILFWKIKIYGSMISFLGSFILTMLSTLSIGLMVGGIAKNSKSASVIACILYFSMLIFSGATLPYEVMPKILQKIVGIFPLTQGIQLMKATFLGLSVDNIFIPIITMCITTTICMGISVKFFRWE